MRAAARRRVLVTLAALVAVVGAVSAAHASDSSNVAQLDGKLMVAHGDDFRGRMVVMQAWVHTAHGDVQLGTSKIRHAQLLKLSGKNVHVRATRTDASAPLEAVSISGTATDVAPAPKAMRIAVVLLQRTGEASTYSTDLVNSTFFGATGSVKGWMEENAGGQVAVTGKVFGPYPAGFASNCDLKKVTDIAATKAAADGYTAGAYDHIVAVSTDRNCGYSGIAFVPGRQSYLAGWFGASVAEHELGHNLGVLHAGSNNCGTNAITDGCVPDYGDPYDVMGTSSAHYSAAHKDLIGWMPQSEVQTVNTGSATIALTAEENPSQPGTTQLVYVPQSDGNWIAIERRAKTGYDSSVPAGVYLRLIERGFALGTDDTVLLDGSPTTSSWALAPGTSWADPMDSRITLKNINDASVQVCFGACGSNPGSTTTTSSTTTSSTSSTSSTTSSTSTTTTSVPPTGEHVAVHWSHGKVYVDGTAGNDVVHLRQDHTRRIVDANGAALDIGDACVADVSAAIPTAVCKEGQFVVALGAGNDTAIETGRVHGVFDGGPGNDTMSGGDVSDVFVGGDGTDSVDYRNREPGTVVAYIDARPHSGRRSERDTIDMDVERVLMP